MKANLPQKEPDIVSFWDKIDLYKKQGKVIEVKLKLSKIIIEGIQVKKQDGSKVNVRLQPSNLQLIELNLEDRKRGRVLGKKIEEESKQIKEEIKGEKK